jgi:uncharacterized hydrophobic protein (TIGR00271 family)
MDGVDHEAVLTQVMGQSGWSPHYAFMTVMSAGIAVLGLLLSSPAVVIGAMLISPLMNPILGLGFALAVFDFVEARRSLTALAVGSALAIAFATLIVLASPLKEITPEILSRTRPNLFDLMVALFAALAGSFAVIKGGAGTIVGVAIATALMPPLGVVGYGLATWNLPILGGALALFVTNFVTIALAATIMARLYGFGHALSSHQSRLQTALMVLVFIGLAVPLGVSLSRIASEAVTVTQVRTFLAKQFGSSARVSQLAVDFDAKPLTVHSVVIAPRAKFQSNERLRVALQQKLDRPLTLQVDQILIDRNVNTLDAQRAQLQEAQDAAAADNAAGVKVSRALALAAGVPADAVLIDTDHKTAAAKASPLTGADLDTYRTLEQRVAASSEGWHVTIVPPLQPLPVIRFANGSDRLDDAGRTAVLTAAWAASRWNAPTLVYPVFPLQPPHRQNTRVWLSGGRRPSPHCSRARA